MYLDVMTYMRLSRVQKRVLDVISKLSSSLEYIRVCVYLA